jgi:hypothetical protein
VFELFAKCDIDPQNKNCSRYSRLPDSKRPESYQQLLELRSGAASWDEWLDTHEVDRSETLGVDDLLNFDRFDDADALLGVERWLCKGKMAILQGPTGIGKSSLIMQWAIRMILGWRFFVAGTKPVRPLKALIIQAENDRGDMAEAFQDMLHAMKLGKADVDRLRQGLTVICEDSRTGEDFVKFLKRKIERHGIDVVFVDPLLAYVGGDILKQEVVSRFLRNQVNPVLRETGALLIWVHHISKPGGEANGRERSSQDKKYQGLGSSEIQNICREVITLSEIEGGLFELNFTKRGNRLGMTNANGERLKKFNIKHGSQGIVWKMAAGAEAKANKAKAKNIRAHNMVKDFRLFANLCG